MVSPQIFVRDMLPGHLNWDCSARTGGPWYLAKAKALSVGPFECVLQIARTSFIVRGSVGVNLHTQPSDSAWARQSPCRLSFSTRICLKSREIKFPQGPRFRLLRGPT
jgi:hypothetical protein